MATASTKTLKKEFIRKHSIHIYRKTHAHGGSRFIILFLSDGSLTMKKVKLGRSNLERKFSKKIAERTKADVLRKISFRITCSKDTTEIIAAFGNHHH